MGASNSNVTQDRNQEPPEYFACRSACSGPPHSKRASLCRRTSSQATVVCLSQNTVTHPCKPPQTRRIGTAPPRCESVAEPKLPKAMNRKAPNDYPEETCYRCLEEGRGTME